MAGWIALHRCVTQKSIWQKSTPEQKVILVTLMIMANHDENEWDWQGEKFKVAPGQFITSLNSIVEQSGKGISLQNVRSSLNRFEKLGFLTNKSTKNGRLITLVNWHLYQVELVRANKEGNKDLTKSQQRPNKDLTPNNNDNNDKNDKEVIYIAEIVAYLNQKTRANYRTSSDKTKSLIRTRLRDGFTVIDFKTVIDKKCTDWLSDPKMSKYLRPETLFGTKFEGYLNERQGKKIPRAFASLLDEEEVYEQRGSAEIIDVSDF